MPPHWLTRFQTGLEEISGYLEEARLDGEGNEEGIAQLIEDFDNLKAATARLIRPPV